MLLFENYIYGVIKNSGRRSISNIYSRHTQQATYIQSDLVNSYSSVAKNNDTSQSLRLFDKSYLVKNTKIRDSVKSSKGRYKNLYFKRIKNYTNLSFYVIYIISVHQQNLICKGRNIFFFIFRSFSLHVNQIPKCGPCLKNDLKNFLSADLIFLIDNH